MGSTQDRRARVCVLAAFLAAGAAACTGSEQQLFTTPRDGPSTPGEADAGANDGAVPEVDSGMQPEDEEDSGVIVVGLGLDPDAVFEWMETPPGEAGACEPGTYTGTFECPTKSATGSGRLIGTIQLTLAGADAGVETLAISKGRITGFAGGSNELFSAKLAGELACNSAKLSAHTEDSDVYPFPGFGDDLTSSMLEGTLTGTFDAEALSIQGEVEVTSDSGFECAGPFTVRASR